VNKSLSHLVFLHSGLVPSEWILALVACVAAAFFSEVSAIHALGLFAAVASLIMGVHAFVESESTSQQKKSPEGSQTPQA
jgi:Na+/H+ antiporter NhaB